MSYLDVHAKLARYLVTLKLDVIVKVVNSALIDEKVAMMLLPLTTIIYRVSVVAMETYWRVVVLPWKILDTPSLPPSLPPPCVCNLLTQIDQCNESISRKTAQMEEHRSRNQGQSVAL